MRTHPEAPVEITRRQFVVRCTAGAAALISRSTLISQSTPAAQVATVAEPRIQPPRVQARSATRTIALNDGWRFGGPLTDAALLPDFDDSGFERVAIPHCVTKLSWRQWDPAQWEKTWVYRRRLTLPGDLHTDPRDPHTPAGDRHTQRVFLHFDGVMVGATPVVNGKKLPAHLGGYLPFQYEITDFLNDRDNVLAVAIDSRWSNVPPEGSPRGPQSIDYLEPGGIPRSVSLRVVPQTFISDVFAKPVNVLDPSRRVDVAVSIDAAALPPRPVQVEATLIESSQGKGSQSSVSSTIARATRRVMIEKAGTTNVDLVLSKLGNIKLWDVNAPQQYEVVVRLLSETAPGRDRAAAGTLPLHEYRTRIGFREARFDVDGFFLNGRRCRIFGLNRHELYPFVGFSMPDRVVRHDAEMLRHRFNCNFVRCSHYPQSEAFLDACDELGLMVWEELPGWQYLGDAAWQDQAVADVADMIRRDRHHPSVVIWGVRINESANNPDLYRRTTETARALDDSRATSGTMTREATENWREDVFAYDNYHARSDGSVDIAPALPGVPYLVAEAVGQFNYDAQKAFDAKYRRAGDIALQQKQAIRHAQAHSRGADDPRCAGVVAWCAFDYGSLINAYEGVKCPGIADIFRIPKLGASFYLAQVDPKVRPVIEPNFYWDFGPKRPAGPGRNAAIFSNCESLEIFIDGRSHAKVNPDRVNFPHLSYPPFFVDLEVDGSRKPELRIDGYIAGTKVVSRTLSSDPAYDRLLLEADAAEMTGGGSDAVRLEFKAVDRFGAVRAAATGPVTFDVDGPGVLVGDNPFDLEPTGGVGALWVKGSVDCGGGRIHVTASHPTLGKASVEIAVIC